MPEVLLSILPNRRRAQRVLSSTHESAFHKQSISIAYRYSEQGMSMSERTSTQPRYVNFTEAGLELRVGPPPVE